MKEARQEPSARTSRPEHPLQLGISVTAEHFDFSYWNNTPLIVRKGGQSYKTKTTGQCWIIFSVLNWSWFFHPQIRWFWGGKKYLFHNDFHPDQSLWKPKRRRNVIWCQNDRDIKDVKGKRGNEHLEVQVQEKRRRRRGRERRKRGGDGGINNNFVVANL